MQVGARISGYDNGFVTGHQAGGAIAGPGEIPCIAPCSVCGQGRTVQREEVNGVVAYELMVILNPELSEEETESTLQRLQDIVREGKGEVSNLDKWGKRRLAYEVKKFREGYYAVMNFKAAPAVAAEVERIIKITDNIIRYLLIRDEKAEREEREKREPEKVQEEE